MLLLLQFITGPRRLPIRIHRADLEKYGDIFNQHCSELNACRYPSQIVGFLRNTPSLKNGNGGMAVFDLITVITPPMDTEKFTME